MSDPYLGNGVELDTNGALTLKGARTGTFPTGLNIADKNGIRLDTTTGKVWVQPPYKSESRVLGVGAITGFTPTFTNRVPGGGYTFAVGAGANIGGTAPTAGVAVPNNPGVFNQISATATSTFTNTSDLNVALTVSQSATLGTILCGVTTSGIMAGFAGEGGIGTRAVVSVGGTSYTLDCENYTVAYQNTGALTGTIGSHNKSDLFNVAPGVAVTVNYYLYYRGDLDQPSPAGGAQFYYSYCFCHLYLEQQRSFSTGDA